MIDGVFRREKGSSWSIGLNVRWEGCALRQRRKRSIYVHGGVRCQIWHHNVLDVFI